MLYTDLFKKMEVVRWNLGKDVPWGDFDGSKITERQLHGIKMNAILEWSAMPTAEMFLRDNSSNSDFSAFISIWFFEEQKHSLVLLEYLSRFAPEYMPTEEELFKVRFTFDSAPAMESLALHFCGEVRLNHWYRCARDSYNEPVIRRIYQLISSDEARHARAYFDYMKKALAKHGNEAKLIFSQIGMLMTNARLNKGMHPTNLHVNKELYPHDTVNSKLPDSDWLEKWLSDEIKFDDTWEELVNKSILGSYSNLLGSSFISPYDLLNYRRNLLSDIKIFA